MLKSEPKKQRDGPHVKKPPNAFMMFAKEQREMIKTQYGVTHSSMVHQILGEKWRSMTKEEQDKYYSQAEEEKRLHSQLHPNWSFKDSYGKSKKKAKNRSNSCFTNEECPLDLSQPKRRCVHPVYDGTSEVQKVKVQTETWGAVRNHPPTQSETMQPWMYTKDTLPSTSSLIRKSKPKKQRDGPHVKKPPNAFMMFVKEQREIIKAQYEVTDSSLVLQILGEKWRSMTKEQQDKYYDQAEEEKRLHSQLHPDWSFKDSYGKNKKKAKNNSNSCFTNEGPKVPQNHTTEKTGDEDSPSAFTLFSMKYLPSVIAAFTTHIDSNIVQKILEEQWKTLSKKEKGTYYKQAYDLKSDSKQQQRDCASDDREVIGESSTLTEECPLDLSQPKRRVHPVYDGTSEVQNLKVQTETWGAVRNHPPTQSETMQPWMYTNDTLPSTSSLIRQQPTQSGAEIRRFESEKRLDGPKTKKPPNAFMMFLKEQRETIKAQYEVTNYAVVHQILGEKWQSMTKEQQAKYYDQAEEEKRLHSQLHPDWLFKDSYRSRKPRQRVRPSTDIQECPQHKRQRVHPVYEGMPETQNVIVETESQGTESQPVAEIRSKSEKRPDEPHVKKPPNAFMMFVKEQRETIKEQYEVTNSAVVLQILGEKWRSMTKEQQDKYYDQAEEEKRLHYQLHPDWSFKDRYGLKRQRKRIRPSTNIQEHSEDLLEPKPCCFWPEYHGMPETQNVKVETETQGAERNHSPTQRGTMQPCMQTSVTLPSTDNLTMQQTTQPEAMQQPSRPSVMHQPLRPTLMPQPRRPSVMHQPLRPTLMPQPRRPSVMEQTSGPSVMEQGMHSFIMQQPTCTLMMQQQTRQL
ncbi:nucleolar transcription factor 1-like isoform X2 [Thalassophryne amazonica]|uniref:nucleolar transcription factor 1-like isoform X2 n=1 Tax=Thalassophryne amazonica TaxID=390379 RepID=UPI001471F611|nr:nucleolar transcription factor 1-like isoform X2 [Thalassophryne amazonica]